MEYTVQYVKIRIRRNRPRHISLFIELVVLTRIWMGTLRAFRIFEELRKGTGAGYLLLLNVFVSSS